MRGSSPCSALYASTKAAIAPTENPWTKIRDEPFHHGLSQSNDFHDASHMIASPVESNRLTFDELSFTMVVTMPFLLRNNNRGFLASRCVQQPYRSIVGRMLSTRARIINNFLFAFFGTHVGPSHSTVCLCNAIDDSISNDYMTFTWHAGA
jgi:hypothetical protein